MASKKPIKKAIRNSPQISVTSPQKSKLSFSELLLNKPGDTKSKIKIFLGICLFLIAFIQYSNTITHDYALDDDMVYKLNSLVKKGFSGIPELVKTANIYGFNKQNSGAYRPFTQVIFAIEYSFIGEKPHINHLINILLYGLCVVLLFLLLLRLFKTYSLYISCFIALLFIVHPVHVEVVANIKSQDELISFLFGFLLTFIFLFRYIDTRKKHFLVFSVVFYFFGLAGKENIITLLPLIPLTLWFFTSEKIKNLILITLPYFIPVIIFMALRLAFIEDAHDKVAYIDNFYPYVQGFGLKVGTILMIMLYYIKLSFFPFPLSFDYGFEQLKPTELLSVIALLSLILYMAIVFIAIYGLIKKNIFSWIALFFLITVSIYSQIIIVFAATFAERFMFLPSVGSVIFIVLILKLIAQRFSKHQQLLKNIFIPTIVILLIFSIKTFSRNGDWKNNDTLGLADVEHAPNSARTNKSAGDIWLKFGNLEKDSIKKQENFDKSLAYFKKAFSIHKEYYDNILDMGTCFYYKGEYDSCRYYWDMFKQYRPLAPRNNENKIFLRNGYYMQGTKLSKNKRYLESIKSYQTSLSYDSLYSPSLYSLGLVYAQTSAIPQAIKCLEKAALIDSTNAGYWYDLGGLAFTVKNYDLAKKAWNRTLKLNPNHVDAKRGLNAIK